MDNNSKGKKKDKSVKFLLAPRPQRDPLAADIDVPQNVLIPQGGIDVEQAKRRLPDFDPTLFASQEETKVGMLERAHNADGMTFDGEVLQAMSKDFDFEDPNNILDDDFIDQAGGLIEDEGEMLEGEESDLTKALFEDEAEIIPLDDMDEDDEDDDDFSQDSDDYDLDQDMRSNNDGTESDMFGQGRRLILFKKKSTKKAQDVERALDKEFRDQDDNRTVFTNYSMTSSVMRRSQGLQQIDEHFDRLFEKEYADDTEIGALDLNDVKGDELLTNIEQIKEMKKEVKEQRQRNFGDTYEQEIVSEHHKNAIIGDEPAAEDEDLVEMEFIKHENRIDCESILTYNSNLYNHPKLIVEPRKRNSSSTAQNMANEMDVDNSDTRSRSEVSKSIASTRATVLSKLSVRPDNETPEERRARKKALKVYRQERRKERKLNQQIFKEEKANVTRQQRFNKPTIKLA